MRIYSSHPAGRLTQAFFASAETQEAPVYLDSFDQPYFFHRTRVDLLADAQDQGKERVLCIKLQTDEPVLTDRVSLDQLISPVVSALFPPIVQGQADPLFKELNDQRGGVRLMTPRRFDWKLNLDFRGEADFYGMNPKGEWVLHIKRYAL